jgi:uncharacterized repeat protein (TIGR03806 family)
MQRIIWVFLVGTIFVLGAVICSGPNTEFAVAKEPVRKPWGIEERELWTTSNVKGTPEPPPPYQLAKSYPRLLFDSPLEIVPVPGRKAWVVAEHHGKIFSFDADPDKAEKKLLLNLDHDVYSVVLHPQFQKNGYVYVTHFPKSPKRGEGVAVSRFEVKDRAKMEADPKSELQIIAWPSGGHSGGCLRFGPDGYLYISSGDGSGIADENQTGQDISDLQASILRIDVDKPADGKNYSIPADNPFVDLKGARGEVYAYGLRQVWKMSFDTVTGQLWAGEVGQDLWESVYKIEKGGNYGWSVNEGTHPFRPERKKGPTPISPPIVEHNHTEFRSLTGGYFYYGNTLPELKDAYIYGDFDTGRIWLMRYDGKNKKVTEHREIATSRMRLVGWSQDSDGEMVALDYLSGSIYHLVASPPPPKDAPRFPLKLSETGLFESTKDLKPAKGLIPYSVNSELWSDGATKERYLAVPGTAKIEFETMTYPQPAPGAPAGWRFPTGTVLVKTFFLETEPGKKRRLETRLLVGKIVGGNEDYGDQDWGGYTYIWNDEQTDAELADAKGVNREFTIKAPTGERKQTWHFPSRAECTMCHTMTAKYVLGVNTIQMNRDYDYGGVVANQLATLEHIGLFDRKLPKPPEGLLKIVDYRDEQASLNDRARAYLHANCSHCHRKWGGGNADFQLLAPLELKDTGTIGAKPDQGNFDIKDPVILAPGEPERSLLYHRMTLRGLGQMPTVGSNVVDESAVKLIRDWIKQLPR